jgi:brefeldin A-inhibited guanine nucleotide-exchange protein
MTGEDLEVRSRALAYLFDTLVRYGGDFPIEFWDVLWRQLLYPIFIVLQSKSEMSKAPNHEELSVWLSTTMIQALRKMITLFTHYFDSLEHMLDRFLDLLALSICQENDTIARIGSNCLQQLILQNVNKFRPEHWAKIVGAFVDLFNRTTAYDLFSAAATMEDARTPTISNSTTLNDLSISEAPVEDPPAINGTHVPGSSSLRDSGAAAPSDATFPPPATTDIPQPNPELEDFRSQPDTHHQPPVVTVARRRFFNKIITNCVLQLLMIETVNELFSNDTVYAQIPSSELLRLMGLLKKSYQFAKKFNGDKDLRMQLWRQGFMKQPPNLLKQESGSANTYVSILLRMYHDEGEERKASRAETEAALIP